MISLTFCFSFYLCWKLAAVFLPSSSTRLAARRGTLADPIRHLCAHHSFKLLSCKLTPTMPSSSRAFDQTTWASLLKQLRQMQVGFEKYFVLKRFI